MEAVQVKALLVDDDPLMRGLVTAFLRSRRYEVEVADDGDTALRMLAGGGFNLVVTDRNMPRMDGLALCKAIRAMGSPSYVYTIMLTSMSEQDSLVAAMEAGVDDFLAKPLRLPELGARLRAAERVLALEAGLASRNRSLAAAYDQLSRELELARSLQLGQLPPPAAFGNLRFDWVFEASSFVGGDIFDYFPLDERHVCFYLADVSGHGVAAAMMAFNAQHQLLAASQQLAANLLRQGAGLGEAAVATVTDYNRRFLQMKETSLYLTMVYGLIDAQAGMVALVQAGHPPPLFSDSPAAPFTPLGQGGLPVGILEEPQYEACTVRFGPGARLVLYSDGVTDCRSPADEMFGEQRLRDLLLAQDGSSLSRSGGVVRSALRGWRGGAAFEDDITFLALEVR